MVNVNKFLHSQWIKGFLKRLGKRYPSFLIDFIEQLPISKKEKQILKLRYIENKNWDEIPEEKGIFLSKSRVMQLHQNCINIIENLTF